MGRFSRFLGKVSIEVGGETLDLNKINVEDVQKLVDLSKKKQNEIVDGVKTISNMISKCMPDEPADEIEAYVLRYYPQLTEEIILALGWTTREKLDAEKKKLEETDSEKKN